MLSHNFIVSLLMLATSTSTIYTLSLHDALPIFALEIVGVAAVIEGGLVARVEAQGLVVVVQGPAVVVFLGVDDYNEALRRSEEHTSELQSRLHLVCRLLLEKKKKKMIELSSKKR